MISISTDIELVFQIVIDVCIIKQVKQVIVVTIMILLLVLFIGKREGSLRKGISLLLSALEIYLYL